MPKPPEADPSRNLMAAETSPYLRQHRHNPVHWQAWSAEALQLARELERPVLLSIGYSACHWCHVMAHESFEDPETAELMNQHFINIKLDREERPDLDRIYQTSHQLLSGQGGGWPLTVFIDPETRLAFFTGTYFPPEPRHGLPSFRELLTRVAAWYRQSDDERGRQAQALGQALRRMSEAEPHEGALSPAPILDGLRLLQQRLDHAHGGFGGAPKFPQGPALSFLAAVASHPVEGRTEAADMLDFSLEKMAASGLNDHLGGGFYRYCVDAAWEIPHFEKMLYDNAQLLAIYSERLPALSPGCHSALQDLLGWLARDLQAADGGYYTAIDADSEGEEGRYYLWQPAQVQALLDDAQFGVFAPHYGLDQPPNFEGKAWHLRLHQTLPEAAAANGLEEDRAQALLDQARETLLQARRQRVAPETDDKRLCAWNALLASGLLAAARALEQPGLAQQAASLVDFLQAECLVDGQLHAVWKGGQARFPAYLDDHAALCLAALDLAMSPLEVDRRRGWLNLSLHLAGQMLVHFQAESGGFYFTSSLAAEGTDDAGPARLLNWQDDATPNGNAMAIRALLRLGHLTGSTDCLDAAERALRAGWEDLGRAPAGHLGLATALLEWLDPPTLVILTGPEAQLADWRDATPEHCELLALGTEPGQWPGNLANYRPEAGSAAVCAWVCRGSQCLPPATTLEDYRQKVTRQSD